MSGRYLRKKQRIWPLVTILAALAAVGVFSVILLSPGPETPEAPVFSAQPVTQAPETTQTEEETEAETTVPSTEPSEPVPQPARLTELLEKSGVSYEELAQKNCSQLITVVSHDTSAQIRFFLCREGIWEELPELYCQGYVGRNGVSAEKREGDGRTPGGLFGIGSAFCISDPPDTRLDVFRITADTYWVDDPESAFYNQKVEGTRDKDWNSAEHMIRYEEYRYGFVVEYNPRCEKNLGSAIFFHVGKGYTAGCVAAGEDMVLNYLQVLDKEKCPHILIINGITA